MTGARIEIDGGDAALADLGALAGRLDEATPLWAQIGAYGVASTQRRFEQGSDPQGNRWPPSLRALATGGKTLIERGRLLGSLTFNASGNGVEIGTNVIYAAVHQFGGEIDIPARTQTLHFALDKRSGEVGNRFIKKKRAEKRGGFAQDVTIPAHSVSIPARPFLGIDDDDARAILQIAEDYVAGREAQP